MELSAEEADKAPPEMSAPPAVPGEGMEGAHPPALLLFWPCRVQHPPAHHLLSGDLVGFTRLEEEEDAVGTEEWGAKQTCELPPITRATKPRADNPGQDLLQICAGNKCELLGIGRQGSSLLPLSRPVQTQVISGFKQQQGRAGKRFPLLI